MFSVSRPPTRGRRLPICFAPPAFRQRTLPAWAYNLTSVSVNDRRAKRYESLQESGVYVQYGCGLCAPDRWLNFDASPRLKLERSPGLRTALRATAGLIFPANVRAGDIVRGLPVADASAQGVYCSHVLEHLPRDDVPTALRNTHRMLAPGGLFRMVVPDLQWRAAQYLRSAEREDAAAADALLTACALGTREKPRD